LPEIAPNIHPIRVYFPIALISVSAFFHRASIVIRSKPPLAALCAVPGPAMLWRGALAAFMPSPWIKRGSCRLVVFIVGSILVGSVNGPANAAGLTLPQAIDIAVQNNLDLQAARYAVDEAHGRLLQAGLPPNPQLDLATKNDRLYRNEGEYTASIGISQKFPVAGRIARQKDVARVDVALAQAEIGQAELKLAGDVTSVFYNILALDRQIEVRERLIDVDQKLLLGTRNRFKAAEVSELDVNSAQLELQRLTQERALLLSQRMTQLARLDQFLGRPATQPLALDDTLPTTDKLPSLEEQQQQALKLRPDLRFALLSADRARADLALAHAQRFEDWTVSAGAEQGRQVIDGGPPQGTSRSLGLSLSIPLPLLNNNQGRTAEAAAAGKQAYAHVEALTLNILNEVASAYAEAERLQHAVAEYQSNMLALSARNVSLAQKGYNQGLISIVEVVLAQRQQGELNMAYLNTLDQYLQTLARLRTAVGISIRHNAEPDRGTK
jgi:cobalt-zinc-cadmium efflux system outer membrane protein